MLYLKNITEMTDQFWEKLSIAAISALLGGAPGYFLIGPSKPDRAEVFTMIQRSTPTIVETIIKDLRGESIQLDKRLAVMDERLSYIVKILDENERKNND